MVDRSKEYEVELKVKSELSKEVSKLEGELLKIEKALKESAGKISQSLDKEAKKFIERARRIIEFGDLEEIKKLSREAPELVKKIKSGEGI